MFRATDIPITVEQKNAVAMAILQPERYLSSFHRRPDIAALVNSGALTDITIQTLDPRHHDYLSKCTYPFRAFGEMAEQELDPFLRYETWGFAVGEFKRMGVFNYPRVEQERPKIRNPWNPSTQALIRNNIVLFRKVLGRCAARDKALGQTYRTEHTRYNYYACIAAHANDSLLFLLEKYGLPATFQRDDLEIDDEAQPPVDFSARVSSRSSTRVDNLPIVRDSVGSGYGYEFVTVGDQTVTDISSRLVGVAQVDRNGDFFRDSNGNRIEECTIRLGGNQTHTFWRPMMRTNEQIMADEYSLTSEQLLDMCEFAISCDNFPALGILMNTDYGPASVNRMAIIDIVVGRDNAAYAQKLFEERLGELEVEKSNIAEIFLKRVNCPDAFDEETDYYGPSGKSTCYNEYGQIDIDPNGEDSGSEAGSDDLDETSDVGGEISETELDEHAGFPRKNNKNIEGKMIQYALRTTVVASMEDNHNKERANNKLAVAELCAWHIAMQNYNSQYVQSYFRGITG